MNRNHLVIALLALAVLLPVVLLLLFSGQGAEAHAGWHYQYRCVMGAVQRRNLFGTIDHYWTYVSNWYIFYDYRC